MDRIGEDRKENTPKAPKGAHTLPMPADWTLRRIEIMQGWLDYREANRKRVKPASWSKLLDRLSILDDEALDFCVSDSIANGWQGLFPDKFTHPRPTGIGQNANLPQKKEGAAGVKAADFPWRDVAVSCEGWTPDGDWADQTPRTRKALRATWAALSPSGKSAIWTLAQGEQDEQDGKKKEGGADV